MIVADSYAGARIPHARYLTALGFEVDEADSGDSLLTLIDRSVPQVIRVEKDLPQSRPPVFSRSRSSCRR